MATVFDVAKYILEERGEMTAMKLQKLVYYSQAWHSVWAENHLFQERIEAWANGAVVPDLYNVHRGMFKIDSGKLINGDSINLSEQEKANIDIVLDYYGGFSAQQLSDFNHQEDPWKNAREGLSPLERSDREITKEAIYEYHLGIWNAPKEE